VTKVSYVHSIVSAPVTQHSLQGLEIQGQGPLTGDLKTEDKDKFDDDRRYVY